MFEISREQIKKLNVKSIKEMSYHFKNGQVNNTFDQETIYEYDMEGNCIYQKSDLYESSQFQYVLYESLFEHNQFGKIIKHIYNSNITSYINIYEINYNQKGLLIEEKIHNLNTNEKTKITYKYDINSLLTEETVYSETYGIIEQSAFYIYNDSHHRVKEISKAHLSPEIQISNEFDKNGNKIKSTVFNEDGSIQVVWTNTYDEQNKLLEFISERYDDINYQKDIYYYNGSQLPSEIVTFNRNLEPISLYKFEYQYFNGIYKICFAIVEASTQALESIKSIIIAKNQTEKLNKEISLLLEIIYFYLHMTIKQAHLILNELRFEEIKSEILEIISSSAIDTFYEDLPEDSKVKMTNDFCDTFNTRNIEYSKIISSEHVNRKINEKAFPLFRNLFMTLTKKIMILSETDENNNSNELLVYTVLFDVWTKNNLKMMGLR